jgi:2-dehydropantoate 2-reductase
MGCLHAALFAEADLRVTLLDHRPERAAEIAARGVRLTFPDGAERAVAVPCTAEPAALSPAGLLVVFTKACDTAAALAWARAVVGPKTTVLTLQNGLGNWEMVEEFLGNDGGPSLGGRRPADANVRLTVASAATLPRAAGESAERQFRVLAGSTSSGATLTGVGEIRVAALGETILGSPAADRPCAEAVAALFARAGLPAQVTDDVDAALWRKAILNAAVNPLGALTRRRNGELLEVPALRELLGQVATEAHAVALALGIGLGERDPVAAVEEVCRKTATNQCSMLQDVRAGRRTEIEQINGEIVRRAAAAGVPTPLNQALVALVAGL